SAEGLVRLGRQRDGLSYIRGAAVVAGLALLLVSQDGGDLPERAAAVFGICGIGGLIVNGRWRQAAVSAAAFVLGLVSLVYALSWLSPEQMVSRTWLLALLMVASGALALGLLLANVPRFAAAVWVQRVYVEPLVTGAALATILALLLAPFTVAWSWLIPAAGCALWLGVLWLILCWTTREPGWLAACQTAVTGAVLLGVTAWLAPQDWVLHTTDQLLDLRSLQAYVLGLALLSLGWMVLRRLGWLSARLRDAVRGSSVTIDSPTLGLVIGVQLARVIAGIAPHVLREIVPSTVVLPGFPPAPYEDVPLVETWLSLIFMAAGLTLALWEARGYVAVPGWVALALMATLLG